jgi:hypothetical protein
MRVEELGGIVIRRIVPSLVEEAVEIRLEDQLVGLALSSGVVTAGLVLHLLLDLRQHRTGRDRSEVRFAILEADHGHDSHQVAPCHSDGEPLEVLLSGAQANHVPFISHTQLGNLRGEEILQRRCCWLGVPEPAAEHHRLLINVRFRLLVLWVLKDEHQWGGIVCGEVVWLLLLGPLLLDPPKSRVKKQCGIHEGRVVATVVQQVVEVMIEHNGVTLLLGVGNGGLVHLISDLTEHRRGGKRVDVWRGMRCVLHQNFIGRAAPEFQGEPRKVVADLTPTD